MGLFPVAIYLAESGFDIASLLAEQGFSFGGPNTHSLSPVTWLTAGVLAIGLPAPLRVLHGIHFAIGAIAAVGVYRLAGQFVDNRVASAVAVATFLYPSVAAQLGYVYLEVPLMAAAVWCIFFVVTKRRRWALSLACLAVAIKPTGLFVVPSLLTLESEVEGKNRSCLMFRATLLVPPIAVASLMLLASPAVQPLHSTTPDLMRDNWRYLSAQWDLVAIWVTFVVLLVRDLIMDRVRNGHEWGLGDNDDVRRSPHAAVLLPPVAFVLLFMCLPIFGLMFQLLSRYYVVVLPFLLLAIAISVQSLFSRRASLIALGVLVAVSIVNHRGGLYPNNDQFDFPRIERSTAYRDLLRIQQESLSFVETRFSDTTPVIFGLPQHYMTVYPGMGYVRERWFNGRSVWLDPELARGDIECYPQHFVLIVDYGALGGGALYRVWAQAQADSSAAVRVTTFVSNQFEGYVVDIRRGSQQGEAVNCEPDGSL
jgi:hypothetical protein